jgi:SPP1 gp7 family putative phage head morphogenesis protein
MAPLVQQALDVGESHAALIARDQTLKFNGALQQAHQVSNGITEFVWLTVGDGSVRDSHKELNGRTFSWANPPTVDGQRATPGQPIQCRCQAVPKVALFDGI